MKTIKIMLLRSIAGLLPSAHLPRSTRLFATVTETSHDLSRFETGLLIT